MAVFLLIGRSLLNEFKLCYMTRLLVASIFLLHTIMSERRDNKKPPPDPPDKHKSKGTSTSQQVPRLPLCEDTDNSQGRTLSSQSSHRRHQSLTTSQRRPPPPQNSNLSVTDIFNACDPNFEIEQRSHLPLHPRGCNTCNGFAQHLMVSTRGSLTNVNIAQREHWRQELQNELQ